MKPELKKVITKVSDAYIPIRVLIVNSKTSLEQVVESNNEDMEVQMALPELTEIHKADDDKGGYRLKLQTGLRFVPADKATDGADIQNGSDELETPEVFEIGAIYATFYVELACIEENECTEDEILEFGTTNIPLTIWPYFREHCHSVCMRAGIPAPPIGLFRLEKFKRHFEKNTEETDSKDIK